MERRNVRVIIKGRVQGVFFRQSTKSRANSLEVSGWIKNKSDGSVEAVFSGPDGAVEQVLDFVRQGPELAKVEEVVILPCDCRDLGSGFSIR